MMASDAEAFRQVESFIRQLLAATPSGTFERGFPFMQKQDGLLPRSNYYLFAIKPIGHLLNYEHMIIVDTHDSRGLSHFFASARPASGAGILKDYDRVMIAGMSSRIFQRIYPGTPVVGYPP